MNHCLLVVILLSLACGSLANFCWIGGTIHRDGEEWTCEDDCNTCYCKNGVLTSTQKDCRVDAAWAEWGDWSPCSTTCNNPEKGVVSTHHRRRKCIDGKYGGTKCSKALGSNFHRKDCEDIPDCEEESLTREALALTAGNEGCKEQNGIPCCPEVVLGDNNLGTEIFIQEQDIEGTCMETCKKLHAAGITESLLETYGNGKKKCWCEFGEPSLNQNEKNYQTCLM